MFVQGGVVRLQGGGRRVDDGNRILSQPGFLQRSPYQPDPRLPAVQKLEPKPRFDFSEIIGDFLYLPALIQNQLFDQEKKSDRRGESEKERL